MCSPAAFTNLTFGPAGASPPPLPSRHPVYSLVKHGGVRNYLAVTWSSEDFEACLDLNLPCADVSDMLIEPPGGPGSVGTLNACDGSSRGHA